MSGSVPAVYEPLEVSDSIRLLVLQPGSENDPIIWQLIQSSLSQSPNYEALSYMWGNSAELMAAYDGQSRTLKIKRNLWYALKHLRSPLNERILWVDAVCIDQSNNNERVHQIKFMGRIFRMARTVLVWLGTESKGSANALNWIRRCNAQFQRYGRSTQQQTRGWKALAHLCNRDYWKRVWIVQEVVLARRLTIHCGRSQADWRGFVNILNEAHPILTPPTCSAIVAQISASLPRTLIRLRARNVTEEHGYPLLELMEMTSDSKSTNPHDKVFGLLGLASDGQNFRKIIDYSTSLRDIYSSLWHSLIARNSPFPYTSVSTSFKMILKNTPFKRPSHDFDHSQTELSVRGHSLGTVVYAGQPWSSSASDYGWVLTVKQLYARGYPIKSYIETFISAFNEMDFNLSDPFAPEQPTFEYSPLSPTGPSFATGLYQLDKAAPEEFFLPPATDLRSCVLVIGSGGHVGLTIASACVGDRIYQFQNREVTMITRCCRDGNEETQVMICSALLPWRCDGNPIHDAPVGSTAASFCVTQNIHDAVMGEIGNQNGQNFGRRPMFECFNEDEMEFDTENINPRKI
ncbi:Heterokaryon incompatibility protein 6 OR allele [Lachnellula suecica]|uniref:Heterokaryon incompatibility protein 6 OR allele n=1 Tax=Lachnellula suecica TaxID=602035 RepID=A0A8T9CD94_9HELO|nr:Heterokaryon incompatibility protein 6 OR allele [Lachnellula suecica]